MTVYRPHDPVRRLLPWLVIVCGILGPCTLAEAPDPNFPQIHGASPLQFFPPEVLGGGATQVWSGVQDARGILYFVTNPRTLLQYDGHSWQHFALPFGERPLFVDAEGRFHMGDLEDLGYLHWSPGGPDAGTFETTSILEGLELGELGTTENILAYGGGVVYCTDHYLVWLKSDGSVEVLATYDDGDSEVRGYGGGGFGGAFVWRDQLHVSSSGKGLWVLDDGQWRPVEGNEQLVPTDPVALLPHDDTSALVATSRHGLFLLDDRGVRPVPSPAHDYLVEHRISHGIRTLDGDYVLTTSRGGAVRLDATGRVVELFDPDHHSDLNDTIYNVFEDRSGSLWFSTDNGVVHAPRSPLRTILEPEDIEGTLHRTQHFEGRLYVATRIGLYRQVLPPADDPLPRSLALETVDSFDSAVWHMMPTEDTLLVGAANGIFTLTETDDGPAVTKLCESLTVNFFRSRLFPGVIFAGSRSGLRVLRRDGDRWICEPPIEGVDGLAYELVETDGGTLLVRDSESRLYVIDFPQGLRGPPAVATHALPEGQNILLEVNGRAVVSNSLRGHLHFKDRSPPDELPFVPDPRLADLRNDVEHYQFLVQQNSEDNLLWLTSDHSLEVATQTPKGDFRRRRAAPMFISYWCDIRRDPERALYWLTNGNGIYLWDPSVQRRDMARHTSIRTVRHPREELTLLIDGRPTAESADIDGVRVPFEHNALRFEFAAPTFDQLGPSQYQYRLEGFDDTWSDWIPETSKEYTNLWEGSYAFRVRAMDAWGMPSAEDSFHFTVAPPPYRTAAAYAVYGLVLFGLVALIGRWQHRKLERERALNRRLLEVDRLKDAFLANTSHELKTPLYGITGLAESVLVGGEHTSPETLRHNLSMIVASGRRLGRLVDDILDFSKLRHGGLELRRRAVDVCSHTEVVLTLLRPLVGSKDLELRNDVPEDLPHAYADEDRLQQIFYNLVGNAIKFTDSGTVTVDARAQGNRLSIRVRDTGVGIPLDQQASIFGAFEQGDPSVAREYGGTGLGLAVTAQLVELHGGTLRVDSKQGEGSTFFFDLPVARPSAEALQTLAPSPLPVLGTAPLASALAPSTPNPRVTVHPAPSAPGPHSPIAPGSNTPTRILVVDDEPINLRLLHNHLMSQNFELALASNGPEALALLAEAQEKERPFDLVLLDVMMPKMSGYEVCRAIRREHPPERLPILFLSAMNREEDRMAGFDHGANDYLDKPIARGELLARVGIHLELLRAHRLQEQEVETLRGLLPICTSCKRIRDEEGHWDDIEVYVSRRSEANFSHGICPDCVNELYPGLLER